MALAIPRLRERAAFKIYVKVEDSLRWSRIMSFYREFKGLEKSETEQILFDRETEETPFVKATEYWADLTFEGSGGT